MTTLAEPEAASAVAAVDPAQAPPAGASAWYLGLRPDGAGPLPPQAVIALQRAAGNAATVRVLHAATERGRAGAGAAAPAVRSLQRTCSCASNAPSSGACDTCATCDCGAPTAAGGACAACGNGAVDRRPMAAIAQRRMSSRTIQRDAAAKQQVSDAIKKPDPDQTGVGYQDAFRILNGLAMFDLLSTLTALRRAGQFDDLNGHFQSAVGVNVPRLRLAFEAVSAKGAVTADDFVLGHTAGLLALPLDQRQDIATYLDPKWLDELKITEDAEPLIAAIRATKEYSALTPEQQALTEEIIAESKKKLGKLVYYMTKLKALFDTPLKAPDVIAKETSARTTSAAAAESKRLAKPGENKNAGLEEKAARDPTRKVWEPMPGKYGGGTYYINRTDPTNIVVKASVYLRAAGKGKAKDVAQVKKMEDAIEKSASNTGYIVDITFVKSPTPDAFTADVNPGEWEDATNWAGGDPVGFAHELHHMFAFELDRYDYIESHAENDAMKIPDRLHWFRQELNKPDGYNDPTSIMNNAAHPNDDDICRVAGLELASCVAARQKKRATP